MNVLKVAVLLIILLLLCSCSVDAQSVVKIDGRNQSATIPGLDYTIANYFHDFNDIHKWSNVATNDFIKQAYSLCSGDTSDSKTIEEMKNSYFEINQSTLDLAECNIDKIDQIDKDLVNIRVTRTWENGDTDQVSYAIIKVNDKWLIDQRF
ncbi:hypothetical protein QCD85_12575 [Paenibacillus sp. PsM32]|uniref:hypothetical protein n=1 Tax=Paenibacillus sp. PsM32 TaxID=3030536 RepID=UPI00263AE811|nr:hypothetical protein [Paenibacillus sp. PsM32]MDN4618940.1 hypothetical protein [Paenibacillus sp. PsM32]